MTWTDPNTWAFKELANASKLNTYLRDNVSYLKTAVDQLDNMTVTSAKVYNSSDISLPNDSAWHILSFNSELWDSVGLSHDNSTNNSRLTCNLAGKYLFLAHLDVQITGASPSELYTMAQIIKNGGTTKVFGYRYEPHSTDTNCKVYGSAYLSLAVNDYVEVQAYNLVLADCLIKANNYSPLFAGYRMSD